ncbi:zinc finger protein swm-like [Teleopsis dalmanni]|uniref:zinc finger protein swm-like n=1 Tax=Teleopsis dalmanni TaxID=139649 RepID=UPI0018CD342C|nr:zinc finger protein swm-like [Teleopsis dalmanni]
MPPEIWIKSKDNNNGGSKSNDARDFKIESAATSLSGSVAVNPPTKVVTDKEYLSREGPRRRLSSRSRSNLCSRSRTRMRSPCSRSCCRSVERPRRSRSRERRVSERKKPRQIRKSPQPPSTRDSRYSTSHDRRRGVKRKRGIDDRSPRFNDAISVGSSRKPRVARKVSRSKYNSSERGRNKIYSSRSSCNIPDRHQHPHPHPHPHPFSHPLPHLEHDNVTRQRCRDFDEKGYCVCGETCPWDHGVNPVVFENINNTALISMSLREYNPGSPDMWPRSNPNIPLVGDTGAIMTRSHGDMNAANINPFTGVPRPGVVMAGPVVSNSVAPNPNIPLVGGTGAIMVGGPGAMNAANINPFTGIPRPGVVMTGPVVPKSVAPNPNIPLVGGTGAIMVGGPGDMNTSNINPFTGVPRPGVVMTGPVVSNSVAPIANYARSGVSGTIDVPNSAAPIADYTRPGVSGIISVSNSVAPIADYTRPGVSGTIGVPNSVAPIADYERPVVSGTIGFRGITPFSFNQSMSAPLQRELITIPVVDINVESNASEGGDNTHHGKRRYEGDDNNSDGSTPGKMPVKARIGSRVPLMQSNCSLELRKVPRGRNTITHLNNHFSKFGKVVNIQVSYDGDPEASIVTFNGHAEANLAYRSTEAVFNNRFIKVFWHNSDASAHSTATESTELTDQRRKRQYHLNNVITASKQAADAKKSSAPATVTSQSAVKSSTATIATIAGKPTMTSIRAKSVIPRNLSPAIPNALLRKKQGEQHEAAVQLANGLRKRKQELMQSYVKQMKQALDLVERCEPNDPQRQRTLDTVKVLQDSIDKSRKDISADTKQMQAQLLNYNLNHNYTHYHNNTLSRSHSHSHHSYNHQQQQATPQTTAAIIKKTKEQQKKELLDIELELFAQQREGNDTTAIQKRVEELQRSLGVSANGVGPLRHPQPSTSGKGTHYAGNRPNRPNRARSMYADVSTRVDRRPKTIVITGFTAEEAYFVLGHFKHFGEVLKHDIDKKIPQLIITYATRFHAEYASVHGKVFKNKRLHIIWAPVVTATPAKPTATITAPLAVATSSSIEKETSRYNDVEVITESLASDKSEKGSSDSEDRLLSTLPELRFEDEEEDEDAKDRSWRR